jgi:riboflavin biosynthesis pyrimidine reductase
VPIAVVTRTAQLDWQSPFFTQAIARPIVLTVDDAPAENLGSAAEVADVIVFGTGGVDFGRALEELGARGHRNVLAEGGPTLNGQLAHAGVIDELCLTLSPSLAGGNAKRIIAAAALPMPTPMALLSVLEDDGFLFLRYRTGSKGGNTA